MNISWKSDKQKAPVIKAKDISMYEFYDFAQVKDIFLESNEDDFNMSAKVCITKHAFDRMNNQQDRFCDYSEVEYLLLNKADSIMDLKYKEEFGVFSDDKKLAIYGAVENINGEFSIIIKTVVHKVFVDSNYNIFERKVYCADVYRPKKSIISVVM